MEDEDLPKRMSKEDWMIVDVITIAAPDLGTRGRFPCPEKSDKRTGPVSLRLQSSIRSLRGR